MFYKRKGIPEEDEIVLCKITRIFPNSVFAELLEYGSSGLIHISEVSPGRIRNIRDYVSVGRQVVCKVLRVDKEKGHIDLSLRRVNSHQRREKLEEIKQELKSESLVKNISKKLGKKPDEIYKKLTKEIFERYSHLHLCFKDVAAGEVKLEDLGVDKNLAKEFTEVILEKFKPQKIKVQGEITIKTYEENGVQKIRDTLQKLSKVSPTVDLFYLGAGRYKLIIEDFDYKPAEKNLKKILTILEKFKNKLSTVEFKREKSD